MHPPSASRAWRRHWIGAALMAGLLATAWLALAAASDRRAPAASPARPEAEVRSRVMLSEVYTVDRKYRSMTGPYSQQPVALDEGGEDSELVWIVGYHAEMVGGDGAAPQRQEFMCHSNLDIDVEAHRQHLPANRSFSSRLFTLSQGQQSIRFPDGFGIPVMSDQVLSLTTQVLNLNVEGETFEVRHRVTIDYLRDADLEQPLVPLLPIGAYGLRLLEGDGGYFGVAEPDAEVHGPGCLLGESASDHAYEDGLGRTFTGHWVVPPGREINRTLVTHLMQVPYDTTIHYIAVHLHPFATSLELRDRTADTVVFRAEAEGLSERVGLRQVEALSSAQGVPVFADHEYELVSVYENTSAEPQDSMAVMYIYLRDREMEEHMAARRGAG